MLKIVIAIAIGAFVFRAIRRRRCGHRGFGHHGFGRRHRMSFMARRLGLSREQVDRLTPLWLSTKSSMLDALSARDAGERDKAGRDIATAIGELHEILTPEQLERVLSRFDRGRPGNPFSGDDGPYRTVL